MPEPDSSHEGRGRRYVAGLSLTALGVVYGDIGTSPLYAFREALATDEALVANRATVLGLLSLVLWSLIIVVSIKYLAFVLQADHEGEGGILALLSLATRKGRSRKRVLIGLGLFGTALLYGDGMITPAISVLSAVEGLELAVPAVEGQVTVIAALILIALFAVQHRGTAAIGAVFGPVMTIWFTVIAVLGARHIVDDPTVLRAFDPTWALRLIAERPGFTFLALGAIFLVVTGSEALYADLGHFGRTPIRISWWAVVMPSLVLNYLGQGALVLSDPTAAENPFFLLAPSWSLIPMVALATMATVIASQALISGAFSLTMQAVRLDYLPRQSIRHTSSREVGQVYVPVVNWLLMIAAVGLVFAFGSSGNLAAAYGIAVTTTMIITTVLLASVMRRRWRWRRSIVIPLITLFTIVDLVFLGANVLKIPSGGWFPLVVAAAVLTLMVAWKRGRDSMRQTLRSGALTIERFIGSIATHPQLRVPGTAVYLYSIPGSTPPALLANLQANEIIHETVLLVSVETAPVPHVPPVARSTVRDHGEGFYQITLTYGFMDSPDVPAALGAIALASFGFDAEDATYFLGRERVVPRDTPLLTSLSDRLFSAMARNTVGAADHFRLPARGVVEFGSRITLSSNGRA